MSKNRFELPEGRLASLDEKGFRVYLYPADVKGFFKSIRNKVQPLLILVFLILPWIHIHGRPIVLLDVVHRKFWLFGEMFWAHDVPMLVLVLLTLIAVIAFVTAVWGRAWCGWACPQTVFIEGVFRKIERFIEGDGLTRRRADAGPMTSKLFFKKTLKWFLFTVCTLIISHSFLAYFVGVDQLAIMVRRSPLENINSFLVMSFIAGALLFDFGWFREQFCVIMCPYGRLQSTLLDEHSLGVVYDNKRPDCVDCYRCVQVCPTGVDIRRGTQLECIACTACVDACDEVMTRIKKPTGLIRYASDAEISRQAPRKFVRPRTVIYAAVALLLSSVLFGILAFRKPVAYTLIRASGQPYQELNQGQETIIVNRFIVDLSSTSSDLLVVQIKSDTPDIAVIVPENQIKLPPAGSRRSDIFIKFPKPKLSQGKLKHSFHIEITKQTGEPVFEAKEEVSLVGPYL
ncbi:MAG: 4Fe-4S dicluster domain-containing protein [Bacteriovoracia bacterium]